MIYLDYAATTPTDPRVTATVRKITSAVWGNPSSPYQSGKRAREVLEKARKEVAASLGVRAGEIIFVSSGTESDNLAIFGVAGAYGGPGKKHLITSNIEHRAVGRSGERLEQRGGFQVTCLSANERGIISPVDLERALRPETILVSIMQANNEMGAIQPIKEMGQIIKQWRKKQTSALPLFHTDACQSVGWLNVQPHTLGVDLLTFSGSKIYGPKGVGVLYKKGQVVLEPMLVGGSQENGWRAGTENIALAAGLALALKISDKEKKKESQRLMVLRDDFIKKALTGIPDSKLNGDAKRRLPNNINLSFKNVDGEMLVAGLDRQNIAISTGSACTTEETGPSHVMKAINHPPGWGQVRITLGRQTTPANLNQAFTVLKKEVSRLRALREI